MDQHEAAAAQIAGARQRDGEREAHRDRGIDRVAAGAQHIDADPRCRRLLARHHAVRRDDRENTRILRNDRLNRGGRRCRLRIGGLRSPRHRERDRGGKEASEKARKSCVGEGHHGARILPPCLRGGNRGLSL